MAWSEHVVVRDGVRLVCRDWGGLGQPIVLLHGLAGHAGEWDVLAQSLSSRYRVVAVDQRGHGASERLPQDVSRAAYVADVIAVVDQLALQRPVLVGQSLGGHTAMLTAAAHPGLVRALVLVEAGPGGPNPNGPVDIGGWLDSWPTPFPSREAAAAFLGGGPVGAGWAAGLEEREGGWWPRFDRDVMVRSLAENAQRSFRYEWGQVMCPTLVVLAQTSFVPAEEADEMLQQRPATIAMSFPATGHDLHLEQPEILHTTLADFLEGLA
ncbi:MULTISPECIES: alpha/beta fold hydrolase [unclassified Streptomyces]|uniref:alpha/beta fold hydrolase n=1 Tax=unclassified Streptomyces TaxID=2593676 RepID=UPI002259AE47|nr:MULTISPECIES: alpha/beta hydrolase [unclassified Streptomyces]WTB59472.1 alpha/beta hydrolase [Streptomyces sp. NBC_00826]WTH87659.1 alpha/beta hydrolase [Streptomyces sp. NBC_00825]WTH96385.1 alpha/beta hydrolase [Streptomyces sp. NBC_00822]MCX4870682.1 alpha/beta hydrolase [Streptomyces sp. NBC_00906]MCX4901841.1 alpha/beta hydrolase [Streptomyces sp. NBC_00892]